MWIGVGALGSGGPGCSLTPFLGGFPFVLGLFVVVVAFQRNYGTNSGSGGVTGHFTQVVWQDSTKIGCGYDASSRASHVRWSAVPHCMSYLLVFSNCTVIFTRRMADSSSKRLA